MNIDYNSEELHHVSFFFADKTIEGILSLKTIDFQNKKPGTFHIDEYIGRNHATLEAFLDVLSYFKEQGIQWETFHLDFYARHQSFASVLLQTVNGLNIFKEMRLFLSFADEEEDEYSADCEYLFPGINQNKQLESLEVFIKGTHRDRFEYDFTAFASHLREMTTLKELILYGMFHFNQESFLESLNEIKSLESLHLEFQFCNDINDEGISNIVTTLASHPKLKDLHIATSDQFGELSSKAIEMLLSKTKSLSELDLHNTGDEGGLNAECIVKGLKKNQSLKSLKTANSLYGDLKFSRFFQILPHCPNLEYLELDEIDIAKSDLAQVIYMDRLQRPIILQIHDAVVSENASVVTKLLRCHPEVRLKVDDPHYVFGKNVELEHICELNGNGRYMIDTSPSVPLSLWPLVFENANDKPSIIYEFLKGPCFAAKLLG